MNGTQHKVVGIGFGLAGAYAVVAGKGDPTGSLIAATAVIGCMLPDIDHDKTKIGRKRKFLTELTTTVANIVVYIGITVCLCLGFLIFKGFVDFGFDLTQLIMVLLGLIAFVIVRNIIRNNKTFKWAVKHRGMMHTLIVPALMLLAMRVSDYPVYYYGMEGLLVGYISHLFADMLTVEGCPVLFPLSKKNKRFPTHLKTKDKSCTRAAYIVAVLAVAISYFVTNKVVGG